AYRRSRTRYSDLVAKCVRYKLLKTCDIALPAKPPDAFPPLTIPYNVRPPLRASRRRGVGKNNLVGNFFDQPKSVKRRGVTKGNHVRTGRRPVRQSAGKAKFGNRLVTGYRNAVIGPKLGRSNIDASNARHQSEAVKSHTTRRRTLMASEARSGVVERTQSVCRAKFLAE